MKSYSAGIKIKADEQDVPLVLFLSKMLPQTIKKQLIYLPQGKHLYQRNVQISESERVPNLKFLFILFIVSLSKLTHHQIDWDVNI